MSYDKRFGNIEAIFYALEGRFCLERIKQVIVSGIRWYPISNGNTVSTIFVRHLYRLIFIDSDSRCVKARR